MKYYSVRVVEASGEREAVEKVRQAEFLESDPLCDRVLDSDRLIELLNYRKLRVIECGLCRMWEEMGSDDPRHKSQVFSWIKNVGDEALYNCPKCGQKTISKTE